MRHNSHLCDTSNYPEDDRKLASDHNKQVLGKFKDEMAGDLVVGFIGLRPKMYSLMTADNVSKITAKGVPRRYAQKHLRHELYLRTLTDKTITHATYRQFRSTNHQLRTIEQTKVALSAFDNKRYILSDGISSVPYGHYKIK